MKRLITYIVILFSFATLTGCSAPDISPRTYDQILESGIKPAIEIDYKFPISYQYENGCFAFAVNHVLKYKYDETIDLYEAEKIIDKPRYVLWNVEYITKFLNEYEIEMVWYKDSETFFKMLQIGEPLVIQYPYKVGENRYIGHLVAAYSFDDEGVWVSDSISGKYLHLDYSQVFGKSDKYTRYGFATVWTNE
jgi:hypothetical protein